MLTPDMAWYMLKYLSAHEFYFCSCENNVLARFFNIFENRKPWASDTMFQFWYAIFNFIALINRIFLRCPGYHMNISTLI